MGHTINQDEIDFGRALLETVETPGAVEAVEAVGGGDPQLAGGVLALSAMGLWMLLRG